MHRRVPGGYCWVEELTRGGVSNDDLSLRSTGRSGQVSLALIHGKPLFFMWPSPSVVSMDELPSSNESKENSGN